MKYQQKTLEFGSYSIWKFSEFENMTILEVIEQLHREFPNDNFNIEFGQKIDTDHFGTGYALKNGQIRIPDFWKNRNTREISMLKEHYDNSNNIIKLSIR